MRSVLIVDDQALVRQGLRQVLYSELGNVVFGEAEGDERVLLLIAKQSWDLIVLSVGAAGRDGFVTLQKIRKRSPASRVLVMSARCDYLYALRAQQMGAAGYAGGTSERENLSLAIRNVLSGKKHFQGFDLPENIGEILPGLWRLSMREFHVMLALGEGKRPGAIAADLNLSIKTVSTYKRRILDKLQLKSTAELIRYIIATRPS